VAELAKGVFEQPRRAAELDDREPESDDLSDERTVPLSIEPDALVEDPEPLSVAPEPLSSEAAYGDAGAADEELPTLPPTRPDLDDDLSDDEPTIVEPFAYFAQGAREEFAAREARDPIDDRSTDRPADDRPTDRSMRAARPVPVDAHPLTTAIPVRRASEPRRPPEPPPAPRVGTARENVPAIAYPGAAPAVRVMSAPAAAPDPVPPMASRAAPSAPPVTPMLSSQIFRASQRPGERSKATNFAAGIAALIVVGAAGYLGAMSGRPHATTTGSPPPEQRSIANVDPPPPPVATALPHTDPQPAPSPTVEPPPPPPPPRAREVAPEPTAAPRRTTSDEETPRARRTTSDEEAPRPRPSRTRTPRPPADEESGGGNTAPETRLPDPNEAPAARPTIDQAALRAAFAEGEQKAKACLGATSPTGTARFSVTFAPTGEAVGAVVSGAPFANTLEGQCMAGKFRTLHVPPFTGAEVIVRKSISFL
jgi:hypothetical protein